jgi:hypothetical protein
MKGTISIHDLILKSADAGLKLQSKDGSFPAGCNGPYNDGETPTRNTGHWLIIFLKAFEISNEEKYKEVAYSCLKYLMSKKARPMNSAFWHRFNPKKDFSNGLMGQAWSIEALLFAYSFFKERSILQLAENVFLLNPYDKEKKAWKFVNVDGSINGFDVTYNHQLWFASVGLQLAEFGNKEISDQANHFVKNIENQIEYYPDGVIKHLPIGFLRTSFFQRLKSRYYQSKRNKNQKKYLRKKSIGYHGFNLYALCNIQRIQPNLPFFKTKEFKKSIDVIYTENFRDGLNNNKYSYQYNPVGIELLYAMQCFDQSGIDLSLIKRQIELCWNPEINLFNKDNPDDKATAAARLYEFYRLENTVINFG